MKNLHKLDLQYFAGETVDTDEAVEIKQEEVKVANESNEGGGGDKITFTDEQQSKIEEIKNKTYNKATEKAISKYLEDKGLSQEEIDGMLKAKEDALSDQERLQKLNDANTTTIAELTNKINATEFEEKLNVVLKDSKVVGGSDKVKKLLKNAYDVTNDTTDADITKALASLKADFPTMFDVESNEIEKKPKQVVMPTKNGRFDNII